MTFVDAQPTHPWLADTVRDLDCGDARKIGGQTVDQHLHVHAADLWHVVVFFAHVGWQFRDGVLNLLIFLFQFVLQFPFNLADHRQMVL